MADAPIRIDVIANVASAVNQLLGLDNKLAGTVNQANRTSSGVAAAMSKMDSSISGSTGNISNSLKGMASSSGVAASAMAADAQLSARASMGLATGFKASADAARLNTTAMRETLVVARELSRGNFTRLPGSLTILAQGISSQGGGVSGFAASLGKMLGLIKTVQDAELAEEAVNATAAATAIQGAAERAAAAVTAADTELALAAAQVRVTQGTAAEAAAQARLAAAHEAVALAASEATVAQEALGTAAATANEASAASAAASFTTTTALGAALGTTAIAAGLLVAVFADVKDSAEKLDPSAKDYISTLGLTRKEIKKLKDDHVTWGDVAKGTFNAVAKAAGTSSSQFKSFWTEALEQVAQVGISAAQVIVGAFAGAATFAKKSGLISFAMNAIAPGTGSVYEATNPSEGPAKAAKDAIAEFKKTFGDVGKFFHQTLPQSVNNVRDGRLKKQADEIIADRTPHKPKKGPKDRTEDQNDTFDRESAQLDAETLAARKELVAGYDTQAQFASDEVEAQRKEKQASIAKELTDKKITVAQAAALSLQADSLAAAKQAVIAHQKLAKLLDQQQLAVDQQYKFQISDLQFAETQATNQADRRKVELQLIDVKYAQLKNDLEYEKQQIERNKDFATSIDLQNRAALIQTQIDRLPAEKAQAQTTAKDKTLSPLEAFAKSVPKTAADIKQAIQGIEVDGINSLADSIAQVVTGTKSLGAAFKDMAKSIVTEIIEMTVKMLVFKALSIAFGSFGGGSGGINVSPTAGSQVPSLLGRASGGPVAAGTPYIVGEEGPELIVPRQAGTVISNDNLGSMGGSTTFNYSPSIVLQASGNQASDQQTLAQLKQQQRQRFGEMRQFNNIPRWSKTS